MNSIKHKIMTHMTNEQKTLLLLKISYINMFKLSSIHENKIKFINFKYCSVIPNLSGCGKPYDYDKEYNNKTRKFNIKINENQYYFYEPKRQ